MSSNQQEKSNLDKFCDFVLHGKNVTSDERSRGLKEFEYHTETALFRISAPELTETFLAVAQKDIRPGEALMGQQQQLAAAEALDVISRQRHDPKVEKFFASVYSLNGRGEEKSSATNNIELRSFSKARHNASAKFF